MLKRDVMRKAGAVALAVSAAAVPVQAQGLGNEITHVFNELRAGGNIMWVLLALSIVALAYALERTLRLRRDRVVPKGLADEARALWAEGRHDDILTLCQRRDSVLARVIKILLEFRGSPVQEVKTVADDVGTGELRIHFRRAHPLAVIATLAPLLGLLGTVIGMITAFQDFRLLGETGDPSVFAGAISKALITTATGLVVAVPCLGLYHFFKSKANGFGDTLEAEIRELLMDWYMRKGAAETTPAS